MESPKYPQLFYQALISLGVCAVLYYLSLHGLFDMRLSVPFFKNFTPEMNRWRLLVIPFPLTFFVLFFL